MPVFNDLGARRTEQLGERAVFLDVSREGGELVIGSGAFDLDVEIDTLKRHVDLFTQGHAAAVELAAGADRQVADVDPEFFCAFVTDDIGAADQRCERRVGRRRSAVGAAALDRFVDREG